MVPYILRIPQIEINVSWWLHLFFYGLNLICFLLVFLIYFYYRMRGKILVLNLSSMKFKFKTFHIQVNRNIIGLQLQMVYVLHFDSKVVKSFSATKSQLVFLNI